MKSENLKKIILDFLNGALSEDEFNDLTRGYTDKEIKRQIKEFVEVDYLMSLKYKGLDPDSAFVDFLSKIKAKETRSPKVFGFDRRLIIRYAALFIGIIGIGFLLIKRTFGDKDASILKIRDKAITLRTIHNKSQTITSNKNTKILNGDGKVIAVQKGNKITYNPKTLSKKLVYNELEIPYGKTFEVQLSDGTVVYLNSGSSIRYPVNFVDGNNREVYIKGEAFFHVSRDEKHPFIVNAGKLNIKVLGTQFNVSSYKEDENINTVLVSGSVELYKDKAEKEIINTIKLSPGKIAKWNDEKNSYKVEPTDTDIYTAWVQGKLIFKNEFFKVIRKKLERHYNVTIINHNKLLDDNTFNAEFDSENIEEVMEIFDRNFGINYKIENNKIIIYQ